MIKVKEIKTIHFSDEGEFDKKVNEMLNEGYDVLSTSCGFVNSERYDFCGVYQAILIKEV